MKENIQGQKIKLDTQNGYDLYIIIERGEKYFNAVREGGECPNGGYYLPHHLEKMLSIKFPYYEI